MKYIFVLGRDQNLAKLEIVSILKQAEFDFSIETDGPNYLIIEFKEKVNVKALMQRLAGTVRIAEVIKEYENADDIDFEKVELYLLAKFNYLIYSLNDDRQAEDVIGEKFKKYCKKFKIKAVKKGGKNELPSPASFFSWRLDEGMELLLLKSRSNTNYLAHSLTAPDPDIFMVKDNERPARKFTHGTSFRVAQVMVNILDSSLGASIVDPFCGTGTFLIEGLLKGYNVIGIDIEQSLINASEQNLNWARKKFGFQGKYDLICADSTKAEFKADGCVFEPYMGEFLKKSPGYEKAKKDMDKFEKFYLSVFKNLSGNLSDNAKIVCILPYFKTYDGQEVHLSKKFFDQIKFKHCDLKKEYGIDLQNPIDYSTPSGSLINRKVYILMRKQKWVRRDSNP